MPQQLCYFFVIPQMGLQFTAISKTLLRLMYCRSNTSMHADDSQWGEISLMGSLVRSSIGERRVSSDHDSLDRSSFRYSLDDSMNMGHNFSPVSRDFLDTYSSYGEEHVSMEQVRSRSCQVICIFSPSLH